MRNDEAGEAGRAFMGEQGGRENSTPSEMNIYVVCGLSLVFLLHFSLSEFYFFTFTTK